MVRLTPLLDMNATTTTTTTTTVTTTATTAKAHSTTAHAQIGQKETVVPIVVIALTVAMIVMMTL